MEKLIENKESLMDPYGFPIYCNQIVNKNGVLYGGLNFDKKNVICLGCSITLGEEHIANDGKLTGESWPIVLQHLLSKEYQILNFGRAGFGLRNCIDWYNYFMPNEFSPEMCLIQIPDFARQPYPGIQSENDKLHYTFDYGSAFISPYINSETWHLKKNKNYNLISEVDFVQTLTLFIEKDFKRLVAFVEELCKKNIKVFLLLYSYWLNGLVRPYTLKYFEKIKKKYFDTSISIIEFGTQKEWENNNKTRDTCHLNSDGFKLFANMIINEMFIGGAFLRIRQGKRRMI